MMKRRRRRTMTKKKRQRQRKSGKSNKKTKRRRRTRRHAKTMRMRMRWTSQIQGRNIRESSTNPTAAASGTARKTRRKFRDCTTLPC